jgi:hypothetical protein
MAYKCDGKWVVELQDLTVLRNTIIKIYGRSYARDVHVNQAQARCYDRLTWDRPIESAVPKNIDELMLVATKHTQVRNKERLHVWKYNDIDLIAFHV